MAVLEKNDLWIVDPNDPNIDTTPTLRFLDLNEADGPDADCGPGFFLWANPSFGQDALTTVDLASYGRDGSKRAGKGRDDRVLNFTLGYKLNENLPYEERYAQAFQDLSLLGQALDREGMLAWQIRGAIEPVFYDYKESPIPEMLRGGAGALPLLFEGNAAPDGLPIDLTVHPWPRWSRRSIPAGTVNNDAGARALILSNPGDRPSEFRLSADVNGGSVAGLELSFRTEGNLSEWADTYSADASSWTPKIGDTTESAGIMHTTFGTEEVMEWRFRDSRTWIDPTSMEGVHRAKIRLRLTDADQASEFRIQMRHGFSGDDYAQESGVVIPLYARDLDTPDWVEVDLGKITVPKGATALDIDIFVSREEGTGELDYQQINLIPASVWTFAAYTPGLREGEWGRETFDAAELVGTGTMKRGNYRLNDVGEYARTRPGSGTTGGGRHYPAGVHAAELYGSVREPSEVETSIGVFEVVESSTGDRRKAVDIRSRDGRRKVWFGKKPRKRKKFFFTVTAADVSGGEKFFLRVQQFSDTDEGRVIDIDRIIHSFIRAVTSTTPMIVDTMDRRSYVEDVDGVTLFPLVPENEWPLLPPGDFGIVVSVYDIPPDPGYDNFDERESLPISKLNRSTTLTLDVWPRRIGAG